MYWEINDFKGLQQAKLNLSPGTLTVLAGVNSSGKSSALQSVLLAAQSMYHDGPVVLNGPLARLGEAPDLVRNGAKDDSIRIALSHVSGDLDNGEDAVGIEAKLDLVPSGDGTVLGVRRVSIDVAEHSSLRPLSLDKNHARSSDLTQLTALRGNSTATDFLHVKALLSSDKRALRTYVGFRGLLPVEVIQLDNIDGIARKYRRALQPILDQVLTPKSLPEASRSAQSETQIPHILREFIRLLTSELHRREAAAPESFTAMLRARTGNPYLFEDAWTKMSQADRIRAVDLAVEARSRKPYLRIPLPEVSAFRPRGRTQGGLLELQLEEAMGESFVALRSLASQLFTLADRVQYLGPLRDEPRVVWSQWNELTQGLPVGTRGEFSAVVLSRSAKHQLEYVSPAGIITRSTLDHAVNEWLAYLEIGDSVSAKTQGKLGVGVEVSISGKTRDLTAVGVGVSQALPLVVAILRVPRDSIFIVEQPELHLHPAVQARLADFMLNARPDLTVVVETHSEAFLTRIRRRVAEGAVESNRVEVTFVEPSPEGATTRNLQITDFGDLNEWPAGFFTGTEDDTAAILRANLVRLKGAVVAGH